MVDGDTLLACLVHVEGTSRGSISDFVFNIAYNKYNSKCANI
jgi:hypothetical protein